MILLDTNVVSAALASGHEERVRAWMNEQRNDALFLCTPVLAELRFGVLLLPSGARRERLEKLYDAVEKTVFTNRILSFDSHAAHQYAEIRARRRRAGRPVQPIDALIAAIASANSMKLATRNVQDFEGLGIPLINPFETPVT